MSKDTIKVYGAGGKKLGEIRAWTTSGDWDEKVWDTYRVDSLGWMKFDYPSFEGKNKDAIINWAWMQVCSSADDLVSKNMPSTCSICGEKSINIIRPSWPRRRKDRFIGVACTNPKCKMYNILIPWEMFYAEKEDLPWNKLTSD